MATSANSDGSRFPAIANLNLVPTAIQGQSRGSGARVLDMLMSDRHYKNNVVSNVLREAWGRFGPVHFTEVTDSMLMFEFESPRDREQIVDLSPWSIHGNCLNVKLCPEDVAVTNIDFSKLQTWVQVHGLSLEMMNETNANSIANSLGRCIRIEENQIMQHRTFLRLLVEVDTAEPLMPGFNWVNSRGQGKWASIRYERLTDICYGCGRIGHASSVCTEQVVTDDQGSPLYGPWNSGTRPVNVGGGSRPIPNRDPGRRSWKDIMMGRQSSDHPGPRSNSNWREQHTHSQAASNRTHQANVSENPRADPRE